MEEWKVITEYPNYMISNTGKVYSKINNIVLKPKIDRYGYYVVTLRKDNKNKSVTIHRLVANYFLDKVEGKDVVNHLDSNKLNNNVNNLEWTTVSGNTKHCFINNETFKKQVLANAVKGIETNKKKVKVFLNDIYLDSYDSIITTSKKLNINKKTIYNSIHKGMKNRKGYSFILC